MLRKNTLNSTAKSSTTNMPPNVVRCSPISVSAAMSAAITPRNPTHIVRNARFGFKKVSTINTSMSVPETMSSGRIAW